MGASFLAGAGHATLGIEIEVTIRQAQAALRQMDRHGTAVFLVLTHAEIEEHVDVEGQQRECQIQRLAHQGGTPRAEQPELFEQEG